MLAMFTVAVTLTTNGMRSSSPGSCVVYKPLGGDFGRTRIVTEGTVRLAMYLNPNGDLSPCCGV